MLGVGLGWEAGCWVFGLALNTRARGRVESMQEGSHAVCEAARMVGVGRAGRRPQGGPLGPSHDALFEEAQLRV